VPCLGQVNAKVGGGMWQIRVEIRGAYAVLVGGPEGKRPFGKPRHRWEDNIKMDLIEVGWSHGPD